VSTLSVLATRGGFWDELVPVVPPRTKRSPLGCWSQTRTPFSVIVLPICRRIARRKNRTGTFSVAVPQAWNRYRGDSISTLPGTKVLSQSTSGFEFFFIPIDRSRRALQASEFRVSNLGTLRKLLAFYIIIDLSAYRTTFPVHKSVINVQRAHRFYVIRDRTFVPTSMSLGRHNK